MAEPVEPEDARAALEPRSARAATPSAERVLETIRRHPGIPVRRLGDLLALQAGTIAYHLARLESAGLVHAVPAGRRRLLFAVGAADEHERGLDLALLRHPTARAIAEDLLMHPETRTREIAQRTRASARATYHHLHALRRRHLVVADGRWLYGRIRPAPRLASLLARLREESA